MGEFIRAARSPVQADSASVFLIGSKLLRKRKLRRRLLCFCVIHFWVSLYLRRCWNCDISCHLSCKAASCIVWLNADSYAAGKAEYDNGGGSDSASPYSVRLYSDIFRKLILSAFWKTLLSYDISLWKAKMGCLNGRWIWRGDMPFKTMPSEIRIPASWYAYRIAKRFYSPPFNNLQRFYVIII